MLTQSWLREGWLYWGGDHWQGSYPEPQGWAEQWGCTQDPGSFHTHNPISPTLTWWEKMKVTGELRFWVCLLLIKAEMMSESRTGETPCSTPLCAPCRTACFSGSRTRGASASNLPIPGMEMRPTTEGPVGKGQCWYVGVSNRAPSSSDGLSPVAPPTLLFPLIFNSVHGSSWLSCPISRSQLPSFPILVITKVTGFLHHIPVQLHLCIALAQGDIPDSLLLHLQGQFYGGGNDRRDGRSQVTACSIGIRFFDMLINHRNFKY